MKAIAQRKYRSRVRQEAKQVSRDALLQAGMELFGEQGLDAPSLDAVCERAGYTRGAFYVHFADRDEFIVAVMDRVGADFLRAVVEDRPEPGGLASTAQRFVRALARGEYPLTRKGGVRPHQLLAACARSPAIRRRYVALVVASIGMLKGQIERDQRTGALRGDVPPEEVAMLLLAAVIGAQTMLDLGVEVDLPSTARAVMTLLGPPP